MSTLQQKLFRRWVERNYPELSKQMPLKDMLHSAYITVYDLRKPIMPTPDVFRHEMDEAYHRHILKEFNRSMHFVLPDPLFWVLVDENVADPVLREGNAANAPTRDLHDLSSYNLSKLFGFVRRNFPQEVYAIFKMAVVEQKTYSEIGKITGRSRQQVKEIISEIERAIRAAHPVKH